MRLASPGATSLFHLWTRLLCRLRGHAPAICYVETLEGKVWHTANGCACGRRSHVWPGGAVAEFHRAYAEDYPPEFTDIF